MNIEQVYAEMEEEQEWREKELRFLHNQLAKLTIDSDRDRFRRSLIVMLYSHFEGFCKAAFLIYVQAINDLELKCGEANFALAAAALSDLFSALRDPSGKCEEFKNELPDDTKLHVFAREREFLERSSSFEQRPVRVSANIVNLEGNLKPVVFRKVMYRLGLPYEWFSAIEGDINLLLHLRNKIAHGAYRDGVDGATYNKARDAVFRIIKEVKREIFRSIQDRRYLRNIS